MNAVKLLIAKIEEVVRVTWFARARAKELRQLDLGAADDLDYHRHSATRMLDEELHGWARIQNKLETRRPSSVWYTILTAPEGIEILDPDGWDRKDFIYSWEKECITEVQYKQRLGLSTIGYLGR